MKKFHFPLEKVREWREKLIAVERVNLEKIATELRQVEEARAALDRDVEANETAVLRGSSVDALSLRALHGFRQGVRARKISIESRVAEIRQRLKVQEQRLMEAQRNARLLEKLKQKALGSWQAAFNKELEEQAAESYLAKWNRS